VDGLSPEQLLELADYVRRRAKQDAPAWETELGTRLDRCLADKGDPTENLLALHERLSAQAGCLFGQARASREHRGFSGVVARRERGAGSTAPRNCSNRVRFPKLPDEEQAAQGEQTKGGRFGNGRGGDGKLSASGSAQSPSG